MNKFLVSYFPNVRQNKPRTINLDTWLKSTIEPNKKLKSIVGKYRNEENEKKKKKLKTDIPCITVSATFDGIRDLDHIENKNGLLCLDIDRKDNPFINFDEVKNYFSTNESVLYCGLSVSGNGVYIIIRISKKQSLGKHFKYLKNNLKDKGLIIDKVCKDYTRLRFFSIDKSAYYNPDAVSFKIPKKKAIRSPKQTTTIRKNDLEKVETITSLSEQHGIDITVEYSDWVKIAGALYNAFGENGRSFFHRLSRQHPEYKEKKANKKFNQCMKMNRVTLGAFFYIADSYGLRY